MYAALQRIPGIYAGEAEIEQWLRIPGNPVESVTLVDALPGSEAVLVFDKNGYRSWPIAAFGDTEHAMSQRLTELLSPALSAEETGTGRHIALYRTAIHFQRILGLQQETFPGRFDEDRTSYSSRFEAHQDFGLPAS